MRVLTLRHATVTYTPEGCYSTFRDGSSYGAHPHDTPDYNEVAQRCGYQGVWDGLPDLSGLARLAFCREHEVCHHLIGERIYGGPSPVLWALAHGEEVAPEDAVLEELAVQALQRFVRAGERPIIGGVDWCGLRDQALAVLDA